MEIGFIGLGRMGFRMAKNLLKHYRKINVYNRTKEKAKELVNLGAKLFESPKEIAKDSNIIITMVKDSEAVKEVLLGKEGAFYGAKKGTYFIDMSTIEPKVSIELYNEANKNGFHFLDAPVIGSIYQAEEGSLIIIVGGDKKDFNHVYPVLSKMGNKIFYVGNSGSGSKLKLINNVLIACFPAIFSEVIEIAKKSNLDMEIVLNVLKTGIFGKLVEYYSDRIINKNFKTRFSLELMLKDLKYAKNLASELKIDSKLINKLIEIYEIAYNKGYKDLDYTSVSLIFS